MNAYIKVSWRSYRVWLTFSDERLLHWLLNELKKHISTAEIRGEKRDIEGKLYECELHKLKGSDYEAFWWLIKLLTKHNWEITKISRDEEMFRDNPRDEDCEYHFQKQFSTE